MTLESDLVTAIDHVVNGIKTEARQQVEENERHLYLLREIVAIKQDIKVLFDIVDKLKNILAIACDPARTH